MITSRSRTRLRSHPCSWLGGGDGGDRSLMSADGYHRICASYHLDEDTDIRFDGGQRCDA
jgi:hypothetical protein